MARGGMEEVELLEEGAADPDLVAPVPDGAEVFRGRVRRTIGWGRRHRSAVAAGAVVVALAATAPVALAARAERVRLAALVDLPQVLRPMDATLHHTWTTEAGAEEIAYLGYGDRSWLRDDMLVIWSQDVGQAQQLSGYDAADGSRAWQVDLTHPPAGVADGTLSFYDSTSCVSPRSGAGAGVVTCLAVAEWDTTEVQLLPEDSDDPGSDGEVVLETRPSVVRVVSVRASSGEPLFERDVPMESALVPIDGDVLLVETPEAAVERDGTARVTRLDPVTGVEVWRAEIPRADAGAGNAFASAQVLEDVVAVSWLGSAHLLAADDGASLRDPFTSNHVGVYGRHLLSLSTGSLSADGEGGLQVTDLGSGAVVDLSESGYPAWLPLGDASAPDVLLVEQQTGLVAVDLTTGDDLWSVPRDGELYAMQRFLLDGRLALTTGTAVEVRDVVTGEVLWSTSPPQWLHRDPVTDGRYVILLEAGGPSGRVAAAYDLVDGRRAWEAPIPNGVDELVVVDNELFGRGFAGMFRFETGAPAEPR